MIDIPDEIPWTESAACRSVDPELFFPEGPQAGPISMQAKQVCAGCPLDVKMRCATEALSTGATAGVWAGVYFGHTNERREKAARALESLTGVERSHEMSRLAFAEKDRRIAKVVDLAARGYSSREIAELVNVSQRQVVRDRSAAVAV